MNKEEALEMLKSLKFNWNIDLYKIPDMCDYFFNLQQQLQAYKDKEDKIKEIVNKNIRNEYRNGNSNEFYLEMNKKELKKFLSILNEGSEIDE